MADEEDMKRLLSGESDLTQCDFRGASLQEMDLSHRDFSGCHLENVSAPHADFSDSVLIGAHSIHFNARGANFSNAVLGPVLVAVNLQSTDMRNTSFRGAHFQDVDLSGADIRGADFTGAHFKVGTNFDDVRFDSSTRFDDAECLRPLSRKAAFQYYEFEKVKLVRKAEAPETKSLPPSKQASSEINELKAADISASVKSIQQQISARPAQIEKLTLALTERIAEELEKLNRERPNEPPALERHLQYIEVLSSLHAGLNEIANAIAEAQATSDAKVKQDRFAAAANHVSQLRFQLGSWIESNASTIVDYSAKTGLLGLGCWFLTLCGAPAWQAFPLLAGLLGGKELLDYIKSD